MALFPVVFLFEAIISSFVVNKEINPYASDISTFFCFVNIVVVLILILNNKSCKEDEDLKKYILISYFIRIAILFWDIYMQNVFVLPNAEGDAIFYAQKAASYAFGGRQGIVNYNDFPYYVSLLYRIMGVQKMNVQFLHIYYAICSILLVNKILKMLDVNDYTRKNAIKFMCFLPNALMITTFFLYESLLSFLVVLSLYCYTVWWKQNKKFYFVSAILLSGCAGMLHMGGIALGLALIVSYPIIKYQDRLPRFNLLTIIGVAAMAVVGIALVLYFGDSFLGKIGGEIDADNIQRRASLYEGGGSVYSSNISSASGIAGFLINTPVRFLALIFAPFPWRWRNLSDVLAFFGSSLFFIYVWMQIVSYPKIKKQVSSLNIETKNNYGFIIVLIIVLIIVGIMFGWGVSNAGSALRHREKYCGVYIVILALINNLKYKLKHIEMQEFLCQRPNKRKKFR